MIPKCQSLQSKQLTSPWPKKAQVKITNVDNVHYSLWYQGFCSFWIHFTRLNSQTGLLCGNNVVVTWNCAQKKAWTWASEWILYHDNAAAHKELCFKQFLAQKSITEMNAHPEWLLATSKNKVCLKGSKISGYWNIQNKWWQHWKPFHNRSSKYVSNSGSIVGLSIQIMHATKLFHKLHTHTMYTYLFTLTFNKPYFNYQYQLLLIFFQYPQRLSLFML